jgi:hypothetical protein
MCVDDNVGVSGVDHFRRERSKQLRLLAVDSQVVTPLENADSPPAGLARSKSSPNLFEMARAMEEAAVKVPPLVAKPPRAAPSASFSLPRIHHSLSVKPQSRPAILEPIGPPAAPMNMNFDKNPAFAKHLEKLHFLIPGHLAYVALTPDETNKLKDDARCLNVSVVSSYLHKQYVPLCADFGPVALNVVHRFCQVLTPRFGSLWILRLKQ